MRGLSLALGQSILRALHSRGSRRQVTETPLKAHTLGPTNGAIHIQLDQVLSWSSNWQAQTYDVYLDTVTPPVTKVSTDQRARSFVPTLVLGETYYWRVDAKNTIGTTTGDVLSFSTWAEADIWTDGDGNPWTDQDGNYIEYKESV